MRDEWKFLIQIKSVCIPVNSYRISSRVTGHTQVGIFGLKELRTVFPFPSKSEVNQSFSPVYQIINQVFVRSLRLVSPPDDDDACFNDTLRLCAVHRVLRRRRHQVQDPAVRLVWHEEAGWKRLQRHTATACDENLQRPALPSVAG